MYVLRQILQFSHFANSLRDPSYFTTLEAHEVML